MHDTAYNTLIYQVVIRLNFRDYMQSKHPCIIRYYVDLSAVVAGTVAEKLLRLEVRETFAKQPREKHTQCCSDANVTL